jgi:hypothetical protein
MEAHAVRYGRTKVVPRELSTLFVLSRGWRAFFYGKDLAVIQDMVDKKEKESWPHIVQNAKQKSPLRV